MLWKCCTQRASKFGKLNSSHRTGKGQFSFQSQRKAMPKNAQITAQLYSSHKLAKQGSKFSNWGFNSTWTVNFQMFKLDLEKAEEPEIKLPTTIGSSNWEIGIDIYTLVCITEIINERLLCTAQGALLSALWGPQWEGNLKKGIYVYV